jgi:hypothetical protein
MLRPLESVSPCPAMSREPEGPYGYSPLRSNFVWRFPDLEAVPIDGAMIQTQGFGDFDRRWMPATE